MTTVVPFTKTDLDQVFDEVENAQTDFGRKTTALQEAEQKAAAVKGLTAAAERTRRDAEGHLQLLELAKEEAESKSTAYASISAQLKAVDAELTQARAHSTAIDQARKAISDIKDALHGWVSDAKQTTATTFENSITAVNGLNVSQAQKRNTTEKLQTQRDTLHASLDQLGKPQEQRLENADRQLAGSAPPTDRIAELEDQRATLAEQLNNATPKGKAPTANAIGHARAAVETARTAAEDAPEVERDRIAKVRLARENLAAAEDRQTAAIVAKDAAERSWIEGIEFVGPGADGFVTANAKLASPTLPPRYRLEWTFDGVPVKSEPQGSREGHIRFDTKGLATGSYAIAVHLQRY